MTDEVRKPTNNDLLLRLVTDIAEIKTDLRAVVALAADHETRIRELEKARWSSAWLTGLLSAVITSGVVAFIANILHK